MFPFTSTVTRKQHDKTCRLWSIASREEQLRQHKLPKCRHQHEGEPFCTPAYRNTYEHCGTTWNDEWSCMCNDRCPVCNAEIEPSYSKEIAPCACTHLD